MKYGFIRKAALDHWMRATGRVRNEVGNDEFHNSFECRWQNAFEEPSDTGVHYSIFCSLGEFNTNLTDHLVDDRFDEYDFEVEEQAEVLFRLYTKINQTASEILTDFQDMLSTFRIGRILTTAELSREKGASRAELNRNLEEGLVQKYFEYFNNIFKHKANNMHFCNHHLPLRFMDFGGAGNEFRNVVSLNTIGDYVARNRSPRTADAIEIPLLMELIRILVNGYHVLDATFQADRNRFKVYANLYVGISAELP
jgi:hypothetical protein